MNAEELLNAYLEGARDEASVNELKSWLKASPENMRSFVSALMFEEEIRRAVRVQRSAEAVCSFIPDAGAADSGAGVRAARQADSAFPGGNRLGSPGRQEDASAKAATGVRGVQGKPWVAAVAGLVLGLCSASLVYGYVSSRVVATASRLSNLMDGSFENASGRLSPGFPREYGVWSGDLAEAVPAAGFKPSDGGKLLRFLRAEGDATVPDSEASACDICQLVDLRAHKGAEPTVESTLEASAAFLDARKESGEKVRFTLRIMAYTGDPAGVRAEWPLTIKRAVAFGTRQVESSGGAPEAWRTLSAKIALPADADFAVVQIHAWKATPRGQAAQFGQQYADDVRLTLTTQPKLPVRTAQR